MTTEQKFKKLLDIAIVNGLLLDDENIPYNFKYLLQNTFKIIDNGVVLKLEGWSKNNEYITSHSINDLVLNTNFFECLFKDALPCFYTGNFEMTIVQQYKLKWVLEIEEGTALEWLFKQFGM